MLNDSHCHFFSNQFFSTLSRQRGRGETVEQLCRELQWDEPGTPDALAERWIAEMDAHGVGRAALIASVPGDEASVATAVARHPDRFVGFFMLDPSADDAVERTRQRDRRRWGCEVLCLFPAMNHVPLHDSRVQQVVEVAAGASGHGGVRALRRAVGGRQAQAGSAQPVRSPSRRSAWRGPPGDGLPQPPVHRPALRRRPVPRSADGRGHRARTSISTPRARTAGSATRPA